VKNNGFIERLQNNVSFDNERTMELLDLTVSLIAKNLSKGDAVSIKGFGTFETKKKEERVSVNPTTGSRWMIPPKRVPAFKPGTNLKEKIKNFSLNES
jgi:DNA-binding protein HU-beta